MIVLAFIEWLKNHPEYKGKVFLFDRGYDGGNFFKQIQDNGADYMCRLNFENRDNMVL